MHALLYLHLFVDRTHSIVFEWMALVYHPEPKKALVDFKSLTTVCLPLPLPQYCVIMSSYGLIPQLDTQH